MKQIFVSFWIILFSFLGLLMIIVGIPLAFQSVKAHINAVITLIVVILSIMIGSVNPASYKYTNKIVFTSVALFFLIGIAVTIYTGNEVFLLTLGIIIIYTYSSLCASLSHQIGKHYNSIVPIARSIFVYMAIGLTLFIPISILLGSSQAMIISSSLICAGALTSILTAHRDYFLGNKIGIGISFFIIFLFLLFVISNWGKPISIFPYISLAKVGSPGIISYSTFLLFFFLGTVVNQFKTVVIKISSVTITILLILFLWFLSVIIFGENFPRLVSRLSSVFILSSITGFLGGLIINNKLKLNKILPIIILLICFLYVPIRLFFIWQAAPKAIPELEIFGFLRLSLEFILICAFISLILTGIMFIIKRGNKEISLLITILILLIFVVPRHFDPTLQLPKILTISLGFLASYYGTLKILPNRHLFYYVIISSCTYIALYFLFVISMVIIEPSSYSFGLMRGKVTYISEINRFEIALFIGTISLFYGAILGQFIKFIRIKRIKPET